MSTPNFWRSDANPIAQNNNLQFSGTANAAGNVSLTFNSKTVLAAFLSGDTAANVANNACAAFFNASSSIGEFAEVAFSTDGAGNLLLTSVPGFPFTFSNGTNAAQNITIASSLLNNATGPSWVDYANNWSLGHVPTTGEIATFASGSSCLYGMGNLTWTPDGIDIRSSFTNSIGLAQVNTQNSFNYFEYRTRALPCPSNVTVGSGQGPGSSRIVLNFTADLLVLNVVNAATPFDSSPAVEIYDFTGTHGNLAELNIAGGSVGIGLKHQPVNNASIILNRISDGSFTAFGNSAAAGGNIANITQVGGIVTMQWAFGNWTLNGGVGTINDPCNVGNVTANAGTLYYSCRCTTNPVMLFRGGGAAQPPTLDASANTFPRTLGCGTVFTGGGALIDPNDTCTFAATTAVTMDTTSLNASKIGHRFNIYRSEA